MGQLLSFLCPATSSNPDDDVGVYTPPRDVVVSDHPKVPPSAPGRPRVRFAEDPDGWYDSGYLTRGHSPLRVPGALTSWILAGNRLLSLADYDDYYAELYERDPVLVNVAAGDSVFLVYDDASSLSLEPGLHVVSPPDPDLYLVDVGVGPLPSDSTPPLP